MAVSNAAVFQALPGSGSNLNAGGFVPGTAGTTDYSQQNAAQVTFDGLTILAATSGTSAVITLVGYTVLTTDKNNLVRIASGTNFTPGLYQITAVNTGTNQWTLDRNCSAGAGAAMVGRMGGRIDTLVQFFADADANATPGGYVCYIAGTLTVTAAMVMAGSYNNNASGGNTAVGIGGVRVIGYASTPGDGGQFTMTTATNSVDLLHFSNSAYNITFYNAAFTTTAGTVGYGATPTASSDEPGRVAFVNCSWTGLKRAIWADGPNNSGFFSHLLLFNCVVTGCTTDGVVNGGVTVISDCYIYSNTGDGFRAEYTFVQPSGIVILSNSIFYNNTGKGFHQDTILAGNHTASGATTVINCDFVSNGGDGVTLTISGNNGLHSALIQNSIFYGNGAYGLNALTLVALWVGGNNAFGANTTAAYGGSATALPNDITLTGDPFTARTSHDFSLNSVSGAGLACRGAGFPGVLQKGGTGYASIGALEPQASGGGSTTLIIPAITRNLYLGGEG